MNQQIKGESRDLDGYLQVGCPALVIARADGNHSVPATSVGAPEMIPLCCSDALSS